MHNKNRMNFATAAQNQIKAYKKELAKSKSNETVTWLILDKDYSAAEKNHFLFGRRKMVWISRYMFRLLTKLLIM